MLPFEVVNLYNLVCFQSILFTRGEEKMDIFWFLFQITATAFTGWQVFNASGGSPEYTVVASLFMLVLTWMIERLWNINNKLNRILKREVPEVEE